MTRRAAILAVLAATIVGAGNADAAPRTTAPAKSVLLQVLITDRGIVLGKWVSSMTHDGLLVLAGPIPRGDYVSINVLNRSKRTHVFTIFGKTTKPIKPGGKAHLFTQVLRRGAFPYRTTGASGKTFRGLLIVA